MKSIKTPFSFNGGQVGYTNDPSIVAEQKIANVLVTNNGERVMNPNYGTNTNRLIFDISSRMEFADYRVDAIQELKRSISSVDVVDIQINNSFYSQIGEPTTATLNVVYRLPLGLTQVTSIDIAVPGQLTEDTLL